MRQEEEDIISSYTHTCVCVCVYCVLTNLPIYIHTHTHNIYIIYYVSRDFLDDTTLLYYSPRHLVLRYNLYSEIRQQM